MYHSQITQKTAGCVFWTKKAHGKAYEVELFHTQNLEGGNNEGMAQKLANVPQKDIQFSLFFNLALGGVIGQLHTLATLALEKKTPSTHRIGS
jgi:hypothetical protein